MILGKDIIYTRWLRVWNETKATHRWHGPTIQLWARRSRPRVQIQTKKHTITFEPIPKDEWQRSRPQHIFKFEFDKNARPVS
jgi:hypothetical protein